MYVYKYSCWENPTDRGTWSASIHRVAKIRTQLSDWTHTVTVCIKLCKMLFLFCTVTVYICPCVSVHYSLSFHLSAPYNLFPSCKITAFTISFRSQLMTNFSKNACILSSVLEDIFTGFRVLVWQFYSFITMKALFYYTLIFNCYWEIRCHSCSVFLLLWNFLLYVLVHIFTVLPWKISINLFIIHPFLCWKGFLHLYIGVFH